MKDGVRYRTQPDQRYGTHPITHREVVLGRPVFLDTVRSEFSPTYARMGIKNSPTWNAPRPRQRTLSFYLYANRGGPISLPGLLGTRSVFLLLLFYGHHFHPILILGNPSPLLSARCQSDLSSACQQLEPKSEDCLFWHQTATSLAQLSFPCRQPVR